MSGGVPAGELLPVTQEDREAAANIASIVRDQAYNSKYVCDGLCDDHVVTQAFARHRLATPTPPIEGRDADASCDCAAQFYAGPTPDSHQGCCATRRGRDADVERVAVTLDVFLAAYSNLPDSSLARPNADDDLLTWGDLRTILAALQALGERG